MITKKVLYPGDDLGDAFSVRQRVFVDEQGFSAEIEIDGMDPVATHAVFYDGDKPVATGRAFPDADKPSEYVFGRISALESYRGRGLGLEIMGALEDIARRNGANSARLGAQCRVRKFYERCGYTAYGDIYYDENCEHIYMKKAL